MRYERPINIWPIAYPVDPRAVQHAPETGPRAPIERRLPEPAADVPLLIRPDDIGPAEWDKAHEYAIRRARAIAKDSGTYAVEMLEELTRIRYHLTQPPSDRRDAAIECCTASAVVLVRLAHRSWLGDHVNRYRAAQFSEQRASE